MWGNYLTVAFRSLVKDRTFAFINILGLALGLAACLLLLLYVRYELSYDRWLPDADRVFQVQTFGVHPETGEKMSQQGVTRPVSEALAKHFPQIESVAKLETDPIIVVKNGQALKVDQAAAADGSLFNILQVPFLEGDRKTALRDTDSVTMSRSEAVKLFGTTKALGRTLTTMRNGEKHDLRVTGIFEDLPKNSHMAFRMVRRFNTAEELPCPWGCVNGLAYVKLKPGVDVASINDAMPAWEKRNVPERDIGGSNIRASTDWRLTNIQDVHLGEAQDGDRPGNDTGSLLTFTIIAFLILGMAVVNFVNLGTARAGQRAREVAVRKVLGARRRHLVAQFLGESVLLVAAGMIIALALLELALPAFSRFLDADLDINYVGRDGLLLPVIGLTLFVGIAGGLYPAIYLSRFRPAEILKANKSAAEPRGGGRLRNGLVIAQFAVSIGLMACTAIVYHQTMFARLSDPGFEREGLVTVAGIGNPQVRAVQETLVREISAIQGVTAVSGTRIVPAEGPTFFTTVGVPGRAEKITLGWYSAEPSFFDTMKIELLAGRKLSKQYANDNIILDENAETAAVEAAAREMVSRGLNVVVNESAAKMLGFRSAAAAVGKQISVPPFNEELGEAAATIVGVVRDTRLRSVRDPIAPIIFYDNGIYRYILARFEAADPPAVLAAIEKVWRRHLPDVPFEAGFTEEKLAELYGAEEARGQTFGGFSVLAILIACLGLFGLAAFTAERRTKEIGIRKVLGARVRDIVQLLAWQFSKPVIIANLIAWPVAWWMMRDWLNGFDSRIDLGPGPFVLAGALALVIAIGTVAGHAIKVARLNPIHALRYE